MKMNVRNRLFVWMPLLVGIAGCAASPNSTSTTDPSSSPSAMPSNASVSTASTAGLVSQSTTSGDWDNAIADATRAINGANNPASKSLANSARCTFYVWKNQFDVATDDCNTAVKAAPNASGYPYAARGRIFASQRQYGWAVSEFDTAIRLGDLDSGSGGDNPIVVALGGKARIFATSTDDRFRDDDLALQFAQKAVNLEHGLVTPAYKILNRDTLAAAYAESGRFDEAINEQTKTIALLKKNGWASITVGSKNLEQLLSDHLNQFRQKSPLRGGVY